MEQRQLPDLDTSVLLWLKLDAPFESDHRVGVQLAFHMTTMCIALTPGPYKGQIVINRLLDNSCNTVIFVEEVLEKIKPGDSDIVSTEGDHRRCQDVPIHLSSIN